MGLPIPDQVTPTRVADLQQYAPPLALICFYLVVVFLTFNQIEEDAFIYFRLAANIAEGHGYVFNIGGERIESGSGLLWQLLLAVAWLLPFSIIAKAKLLGIAFGALALWLTCRIARHLISEPLLQYAPALLLTCSIPFFYYVQRGLETPLCVAALLLLCWVCLEQRLQPPRVLGVLRSKTPRRFVIPDLSIGEDC